MNNFKNTEQLKDKLKKYKIEDDKDKYIFRANSKYIISSSIFFIIIAFIAVYSLYKGMIGIERLTHIKVILIAILLIYVVVASYTLFSYKIIIQNDEIIAKKLRVKMTDIEKATVKIGRISATKVDRILEIITKDKKRIQIRLNISNELLFFKLIENKIGEKLDI